MLGFDTSDDAGIYRLNDAQALVVTADFITPPVDDPFVFGQIAAANALSDVYAMGAKPLTCLNLVAFPSDRLPHELLVDIIRGAAERVHAAGAVLAGGHSIEDEEPKFGLAVTGIVHPDRFWSNAGARPGDALILTQPIGSGVIFNGNLKKKVPATALAECIRQLVDLNDRVVSVLAGYEIHAATDISGFGLAGHVLEMAEASNVNIVIDYDAVPVFDEARELYDRGVTTRSNRNNHEALSGKADLGRRDDPDLQLLLDPQTSGGLLLALPSEDAADAAARLHEAGYRHAATVGRVATRDDDGFSLIVE